MKGKNSPEQLLRQIVKLEPVQFIGICKILGVDIYKENVAAQPTEENKGKIIDSIIPRTFEELWSDVCDAVGEMNRTRRRNLGKLLYPATKKGE